MRGLWTVAFAGLAFGAVSTLGGTVSGDGFGRLAVGYGLLVALASLYMLVGLAIRDRAGRRTRRPAPKTLRPTDLAGRRVF